MPSHCLHMNAYFYLTGATLVIFVFITKFFRLPPHCTTSTLEHVFLFLKTGPHASKEKVVHHFILTFSSFLASLRHTMPRSASVQAGPSNQLSQQSAFQI